MQSQTYARGQDSDTIANHHPGTKLRFRRPIWGRNVDLKWGAFSTTSLTIWTKFHTHFKAKRRLHRPILDPENDWDQHYPIRNVHFSSKDSYSRRKASKETQLH